MTNAQINWIEDMQFVARADTGHAIVMDASTDGGGYGSASSPMEVLLMGVLGCTAMDVISILKKKRQPVQRFKIFATGERAAEHPRAYTAIHLEYVAYGDVAPDALARAIQLSEEKYCGALATVRGVAKLTSSYRVETGGALAIIVKAYKLIRSGRKWQLPLTVLLALSLVTIAVGIWLLMAQPQLLLDGDGHVSGALYAVRNLPTSLIIDRQGFIRDAWTGQITQKAMLARLKEVW